MSHNDSEGFKKIIETLDKEIDGTRKNAIEVSNSLDNSIIAANTGLFALSAGFIQLSGAQIVDDLFLYLAWGSSVLSLIFIFLYSYIVLCSDLKNNQLFGELKNQLNRPTNNIKETLSEHLKKLKPTKLEGIIEKMYKWVYPASLIFLLVSFVLLAIFSSKNIDFRNKDKISSNEIEEQKQFLEIQFLKMQIDRIEKIRPY